jgi:hypothetical protein
MYLDSTLVAAILSILSIIAGSLVNLTVTVYKLKSHVLPHNAGSVSDKLQDISERLAVLEAKLGER